MKYAWFGIAVWVGLFVAGCGKQEDASGDRGRDGSAGDELGAASGGASVTGGGVDGRDGAGRGGSAGAGAVPTAESGGSANQTGGRSSGGAFTSSGGNVGGDAGPTAGSGGTAEETGGRLAGASGGSGGVVTGGTSGDGSGGVVTGGTGGVATGGTSGDGSGGVATGGTSGDGSGGNATGGNATGGSGGASVGRVYGADLLLAEGTFEAEDFDRVRNSFLFFGHQSVGGYMMSALEGLRDDDRYDLTQAWDGEWSTVVQQGQPGALVSLQIGENADAASKTTAFDDYMRNHGFGGNVDIALFKFCFVDIKNSSWELISVVEMERIYEHYVGVMGQLEADFPGTVFVYATMPLERGDSSANPLRGAYNGLVQDFCVANDKPLFDIADIESVDSTGQPCVVTDEGGTYRELCTEWAGEDDQHPNDEGSVRAAKALVLMFADILRE
ncbi:MAG: hypothetical protein JW751_07060 [Polyangiaceae bacterium]|nr:hypothetical protein [Polyangiaceae bacterium]